MTSGEGDSPPRRQALPQGQSVTSTPQGVELLGRLAAAAAHDINGYLTALRLHIASANSAAATLAQAGAEASGPAEPTERLQASLVEAGYAIDNIASLVDEVRALASTQPPAPEALTLGEVVLAALRLARPLLNGSIRVDVDVTDAPRVRGRRARLVEVVVNLLRNAVDAVDSVDAQPHPVTSISLKTTQQDGWAVLVVEDNGPGVPVQAVDKLFERGFTTKPGGRGSGLGLAICEEIVAAHGGELRYSAAFEGGARFEVRLPAV